VPHLDIDNMGMHSYATSYVSMHAVLRHSDPTIALNKGISICANIPCMGWFLDYVVSQLYSLLQNVMSPIKCAAECSNLPLCIVTEFYFQNCDFNCNCLIDINPISETSGRTIPFCQIACDQNHLFLSMSTWPNTGRRRTHTRIPPVQYFNWSRLMEF
jgi:hypothetical protein